MNAAVTVARLATAAYLRQLHAEGAEPEILMNRAVSHADWMTTSSAKAGDLQLADAYAGVTAWLSASRERMYSRRGPAVLAPLAPAQDHGPLAARLSDRTLAKVLSRPAYVPRETPSLVELDRREAADRALAALVKWRQAGDVKAHIHATVALRKAADEYIEVTS